MSDTIKEPKAFKKRKFKMLSAFSILLIIITVIIFLSWIFKWTGTTTDVTVDGITSTQKIKALGIFDIFLAPIQGFINKSEIIIFILMIGAFITMVIASKSLEGFSQVITSKLKGKEIWSIIPLMFFFSICGTTEGMAEESLGFYMIMIPIMIAAGFDKWVGVLVVMVGAGTGVLASTVNPFSVGVAVDSLNKSLDVKTSVGDGLVWRLVCWIILTTVSTSMVMFYAYKIKKNPTKSYVFKTLEGDKKYFLSESVEKINMNWKRKFTLIVFLIVLVLMIFYLVGWDSILGYSNTNGDEGPFKKFGDGVIKYVPYISGYAPGFGNGGLDIAAGFFLVGSIVLGLINGLGEDGFIKQFMAGAGDILSVCLIIAVAAGVGFILEESYIQNLFVNALGKSVGGISSSLVILVIFFIAFLPLSFVIPSTSGFAASVLPLLTGVINKDPSVLASGTITAFSFTSGVLNLFTPTSGIVMGTIAIAGMDYGQYMKSIWKVLLTLIGVSFVLLLIGGCIGGKIA